MEKQTNKKLHFFQSIHFKIALVFALLLLITFQIVGAVFVQRLKSENIMTYGRKHVSIASIDGMWERTIYVSGFSKAFAMTGWRLGYVCAPEPIAKQMLKIHQYAIMSAPTLSQYAAIVALRECDKDVQKMVEEYNVRRRMLVDGFNRVFQL